MWINVRMVDNVVIANFVSANMLDEDLIQQTGFELMQLISMAAEHKKLLISFQGVLFMSSAMIGKLVLLNKKAKSCGIDLKFSDLSPNVLEVFTIARLDRTFRILRDEDREAERWREDSDDDDDRSGNAGVFAKLPKHPSSGGAHAKPPNVEK